MTLKIDRFEKKNYEADFDTVKVSNTATVLIKDHKNDTIISLVQLCNTRVKNSELADRIISTIEDFILENENEAD